MSVTTEKRRAGVVRVLRIVVAAILIVMVAWWLAGRLTSEGRRVVVQQWDTIAPATGDTAGPLRILAWNVAHGRGDRGPAVLGNWLGGSPEVRAARLARIARVLRAADADIVVLNEVDFEAHWSGHLNHAEVLARSAGYPIWLEQRNYDMKLPFWALSFGNAVLSRFPVTEVDPLRIPPHSSLEGFLVGAKTAAVVRIETHRGALSLVPIHLEARSSRTRLAAVPVLDSLRAHEGAPVILAGDFNSSPPGWPGSADRTALGELLGHGWRSPLAEGPTAEASWTYPTYDLARTIDWVLVEPPLHVRESRVLADSHALSDHAAVLTVVDMGPGPAP